MRSTLDDRRANLPSPSDRGRPRVPEIVILPARSGCGPGARDVESGLSPFRQRPEGSSMTEEEKAPASSDVVIESFRAQMEILQLMRREAKSSQPDPAQLLHLAEAY